MASQIVELDRIALIPLSVSSLCTARSHSDFPYRPTPPRFAAQSNFQKIRFNLDVSVQGISRIHRGLLVNQRRRVILGVASAEQPDQISGGEFANQKSWIIGLRVPSELVRSFFNGREANGHTTTLYSNLA